MTDYRVVLNTWWKLLQALMDPRLDSEVRADSATSSEVSPQSALTAQSTTSLALTQLGLIDSSRDAISAESDGA
jgi:hypothetical protein